MGNRVGYDGLDPMYKYGDMDTASRELINDNLWEHMNSDEFSDELNQAKSKKNKNKKGI